MTSRASTLDRTGAAVGRGAAARCAGAEQADHAVQHSPVLQAQRQRIRSAFGPATQLEEQLPAGAALQAKAVVQREMDAAAQRFIDTALAPEPGLGASMVALGLAKTYAAGSARLNAREKSELEVLWADKSAKGNTKNRTIIKARREAAGVAVATRLVAMLQTLTNRLAYGNSFDDKHTYDGDVDSARAVLKGNARAVKPAWNTVFKKSYVERLVAGLAAGAIDGNHEVVRRASNDGVDNIALAERCDPVSYKQAVLGIYQYRLTYSIATDRVTRLRTINITHMETA